MTPGGGQGTAQKMEQSGPFRGGRRAFGRREIAVGLPQEVLRVGLVVETPDEETFETGLLLTRAQFGQKSSGDRGLARSAESDERDDTAAAGVPQARSSASSASRPKNWGAEGNEWI